MKSRGQGEGGLAPENADEKTKFKGSRARSALRAGKMLLQWKRKGEAPAGEVTEAYRLLMRDVKQGVSEAILRERIPPGYQNAIQRYFDSLEKEAPPAAGSARGGEGDKSGK